MYSSANIAERIKTVAKSKGISVKKMLEDIGLGFNTMANMRTSMPRADNLAKFADYLGCSTDYLLGKTTNPSIVSDEEAALSSELISRLVSLTPEELMKVDAFVQGLLASR